MPPQSPSQPPYGAAPPSPPYPPQGQAGQNGPPQPYPPQQYGAPYGQPSPQSGGFLPPQQPQPYPGQSLGQQPVQPYIPPSGLAPGTQPAAVVPPPPPRPETPYDFFMASQPHQRKKGMFSANNAPNGEQSGPSNMVIWIAGGGIGVVLIVVAVLLFAPKSDPKLELVAAAQSQGETLRICNEGVKQAKLQTTRNFVANCALSLASEQRALLAQLTKSGLKVNEKVLALGRNSKSDQLLKSAQSASNFDETFVSIAESQMKAYVSSMKRAAAAPSTTDTEKKLLNKQYQSSQLLLQQLQQPKP